MLPELSKDKEVFLRSAQSFSSDLKSRDLIGLLGSGELYMKAVRAYTRSGRMDSQGNAEASSSRLSEDVDDVMDVDEEEYEADELNEGGWDEDQQEYGGRLVHAISADL